ncbi:hypothetical protein Micbo1qcDRAFT_229521 [Microdochium bolleyi]|uniref:Uncharacterized protein n=1 Tax=Microdochium bolleyi TaxID=196109 RepID=A0A136JHR9_9PEZI|nr:hypothetical protein Micbo1qcDRAFT_229521 [Microdochium bolleyi]
MATPMPDAPKSAMSLSGLKAWGTSSLAPTGLATLITALHFRPLQIRPMLFVPILIFSSYANLQTFKIDSAGITAAASGTYALLAMRRKQAGASLFGTTLTIRGGVRAAAIGLALINTVAGAWVYSTGNREAERRERKEHPRWTEDK